MNFFVKTKLCLFFSMTTAIVVFSAEVSLTPPIVRNHESRPRVILGSDVTAALNALEERTAAAVRSGRRNVKTLHNIQIVNIGDFHERIPNYFDPSDYPNETPMAISKEMTGDHSADMALLVTSDDLQRGGCRVALIAIYSKNDQTYTASEIQTSAVGNYRASRRGGKCVVVDFPYYVAGSETPAEGEFKVEQRGSTEAEYYNMTTQGPRRAGVMPITTAHPRPRASPPTMRPSRRNSEVIPDPPTLPPPRK